MMYQNNFLVRTRYTSPFRNRARVGSGVSDWLGRRESLTNFSRLLQSLGNAMAAGMFFICAPQHRRAETGCEVQDPL